MTVRWSNGLYNDNFAALALSQADRTKSLSFPPLVCGWGGEGRGQRIPRLGVSFVHFAIVASRCITRMCRIIRNFTCSERAVHAGALGLHSGNLLGTQDNKDDNLQRERRRVWRL